MNRRSTPAHARKSPSAATRFEMKIRADEDLEGRTRFVWLLVAMSHLYGYTFMSQADMTKQLGTSVRQVQIWLKAVIKRGYFRSERPKGIHQVLQYHRVYPKGETHRTHSTDFVRRIQGDDDFLDICGLLHWIACDETPKKAEAQFSTPPGWSVSRQALTTARRKMERLGHFAVDSDPRRGTPAKYMRIDRDQAPADRPARVSGAKEPTAEPALDKDDRRRREEEAARRRYEEEVFGPKPHQSVKKRVVASFDFGKD